MELKGGKSMIVDDLSSYQDQATLILFEDVDGSIKSDYYPRNYLTPIIPYIESSICVTTNTITDISDITPVRWYRFRYFVDENTLLYQSSDLFNRELSPSNDPEEGVSCLVEDGYLKYTITNIPFFISRFARRFDIETINDVLDFIPFKLSFTHSTVEEVTVTAETFIDNGIRFPTSETICQFKDYVKLRDQKEAIQKLRDIQKRGGMVFLRFEWRSQDFSKSSRNDIRQGGTAYVYLPYENYDYKDEIWGVRIRPKLCADQKFRFYDADFNVMTTFNSRYDFALDEQGVRSCPLTLTRR
jgi:hypothetical protein